jgi:outer membrane protein assembly factor BamB
MDGVVFAFDWQKRRELWKYEDPESRLEFYTSPAIRGDRVVVSSRGKQVDALDAVSGNRVWRHVLRRRADASPVISGPDVWIASTDGRLIRLSLESGEELWEYEIRGAFLAAPAISENRLVVADDEGVVRCFGKRP